MEVALEAVAAYELVTSDAIASAGISYPTDFRITFRLYISKLRIFLDIVELFVFWQSTNRFCGRLPRLLSNQWTARHFVWKSIIQCGFNFIKIRCMLPFPKKLGFPLFLWFFHFFCISAQWVRHSRQLRHTNLVQPAYEHLRSVFPRVRHTPVSRLPLWQNEW